jgi:hypothetical protein
MVAPSKGGLEKSVQCCLAGGIGESVGAMWGVPIGSWEARVSCVELNIQ